MDFNRLIKDNRQNIKNIIRMITKQDNDDLEQEVYAKIWKNADKYDEKGASKSWVSTITKNVSLDYLKSLYYKISQTSSSDEYTLNNIQDKHSTPENRIINIERRKTIIKAIDSLRPKFKEVIMLCEIEGYSYDECANKLKCPVGTIKSRIFNAKKELAVKLKDLL